MCFLKLKSYNWCQNNRIDMYKTLIFYLRTNHEQYVN